ncbi:glycosyl hydrolase family 16 [Algoriphagus ratkowskyi]|uniref:Glycoside hydrolase family 16 protein n=1 Tax=Algoriphagus ratkowskyi TaxID=57028 RepID=A0A2W7R1K8_9BACT|nr:glycoside hydrolase family 16 protein [Algoriphagus ratkowskyi]PZX54713.1 glycosyl hydrolase family 16 [Algoriphagus ratkowskyi]TXD77022.1 glycoside hydrolase family 16 protein [Algoriphagus ratkowskyi]
MKHLVILLLMVLMSLFPNESQKTHKSFKEDFSRSKSKNFRYGSTGTHADFKHKMGIESLSEPETSILSFKLNPDEKAGPGKGPEIISKHFTHFGSYSTRLKVPDVSVKQANVGAVVGYFTYHEDHKGGLSEIDFEWLLADPRIIYVGTWTGEHDKLQRIGRIINLAEGKIIETISKVNYDGDPTQLTGLQNIPESIPAIENYDASSKFHTYGFDWESDRIRWWMIHPETSDTLVLWDYQGSQLGIPQHASKYRMNFWHTDNWAVEGNPNALEKPEFPFELEVDWMAFNKR